jgi:hypothetical protein
MFCVQDLKEPQFAEFPSLKQKVLCVPWCMLGQDVWQCVSSIDNYRSAEMTEVRKNKDINFGSSRLIPPRIAFVQQKVDLADFTDNTDATGYVDLSTQLLAGAIPLGFKAVVHTAFIGNVSAAIQVGVAGDLDRFSSDTSQSVFTTGVIGAGAPADAADGMGVAQTVRVTVTGATDFTAITAGSMTVTVYYIET